MLWDNEDLERRLCHALDIAKRAVEQLAATGYTDPEANQDRIRPEKVISETAVLLVAASTAASRDGVKARIQHVACLLMPHARSQRILLALCLEPALALDYATAHICLARLGYPDAAFDALLRQALQSQAHRGRERVPHRMLEQHWLMHALSGSWNSRTSAVMRSSVLNCPMDLVGGSRDDVYAFTHAIMYATDFNIHPRRLPRPRAAILAEAEAALARCLDEQDYDLGGEVLLAWPLTGVSWSPPSAFGFRVLARVEDQAGFLPAPSTRIERLTQLHGGDRSNYLVATAYHTIYVMGLLCAAALQPGRTPPCNIPSRFAVPGSAGRLLEILDADGHTAHWREQFDQLRLPERDALAGFLMNVGLRRAITRRDFDGVARLLRTGHGLGLTGTPAASQTAEMLNRLARLPNIVPVQ
ncbi:MAG: hypothetical protein JWO80_435 [Bryobacterales bacterium]|nr:hypothetical protein [Bryobacterales bacterium]